MSYLTLLDAALWYAQQYGWRVLTIHGIRPDGGCTCGKADCASPGKHPFVRHGIKDATTDEAQIRRWWTVHPGANVGIATEGLLVIDVDPQNGGALGDLSLFGELPGTVTATTGSGGYHLFFRRSDPRVPVPCSSGLAGLRGIDVRADGGYIVAPPSLHASGDRYFWLYAPEEYAVVDAPRWLVNLARTRLRPAGAAEPQPSIPTGERNSHLHRVGRALHARGCGEAVILAALETENAARCDPPLSDGEVAQIAHKAGTQPDTPDFAARRAESATLHPTLRRRFELVDDEAILRREPPPQLIEGVLPLGGLAAMAGTAASLKTFLAIHIGFSVATGTPWARRRVKQGLVVYIVAEGSGGFPARLEAWKQEHGCLGVVQGFLTLTCPVEFMQNRDVSELLAELRRLRDPPVLIIVDTLARCFVGGEENSAKDMGLFIAGLDRVRQATGAAVLVVHHSGLEKGRERGSTALRCALDTLMITERRGKDNVIVVCEKQKDRAEFAPLAFSTRVVELDGDRTSLVLDPCGHSAVNDANLPESCRLALKALRAAGPHGLTFAEWRRATGLANKSTFTNARKRLEQRALVINRARKYVVADPPTPDRSSGPTQVQSGSIETSPKSVSLVSHPSRGETKRPRVRLKLHEPNKKRHRAKTDAERVCTANNREADEGRERN